MHEAQHFRRLRLKFGVSAEDYEAMLAAQDGGCALCGCAPKKIKLAVDHCHATGVVRGVLCGPCNTALGRLGDSPEELKRVLAYLEHPPAKKVLDGG